MAVCELAGLAGVLCRIVTQPTPAASATMSQLARIAADMIARPGGSALNPSPIMAVSPLWRSLPAVWMLQLLYHPINRTFSICCPSVDLISETDSPSDSQR